CGTPSRRLLDFVAYLDRYLRVIYIDATLSERLLSIHLCKIMFVRVEGIRMGKQERSLASGALFPDFKSSQNCSPPHGSIFALTDSAELRPGILRRKVASVLCL